MKNNLEANLIRIGSKLTYKSPFQAKNFEKLRKKRPKWDFFEGFRFCFEVLTGFLAPNPHKIYIFRNLQNLKNNIEANLIKIGSQLTYKSPFQAKNFERKADFFKGFRLCFEVLTEISWPQTPTQIDIFRNLLNLEQNFTSQLDKNRFKIDLQKSISSKKLRKKSGLFSRF